jgi:hypothetical protein
VVFDLLKVWRPMDFPEDPETHKRTIDYVDVHADLESILGRFASTSRCSFDQWNSASFLSSLRRQFSPGITISVIDFNERANQARFEKFKSALNLEWIHSYRDSFYTDNLSCLLELELKFLAMKPNGKVDRQEVGPVITKDLADCVMVVTVDLLKDALDRYSSATMTKGQYGSTDIAGLKSGREFERQQGATTLHDPSLRERNMNAKQILEDARKSRQRQRVGGGRQGTLGYGQDRLRSIHTREPRLRNR